MHKSMTIFVSGCKKMEFISDSHCSPQARTQKLNLVLTLIWETECVAFYYSPSLPLLLYMYMHFIHRHIYTAVQVDTVVTSPDREPVHTATCCKL